MTSRRQLGLVAAAATLLATAPIATIFERFTWLFECIVAVAMIAGAAFVARTLRGRVWAQVAAMIGALLLALTWLHGGGTAWLGLVPTFSTFGRFQHLLTLSVEQIRSSGVPAGDLEGLLFVTVLGVGAMAVLIDFVAVGLRRPAVAGLPMLAIYSVPVAVYADSLSPIPFMIGACGFLWLLVSDNVDRVRRFGRRFTGEGRGVDVWEPSPLAAAGRRLALVGMAVAVVLPLAVPALSSDLLGRFGGGVGEGAGVGGGRNPGSVDLFAELHGQLNESKTTDLVKVTTSDPSPFYLRFGVADDVVNGGFRYRPPSGGSVGETVPGADGLNAPGVTSNRYNARITIAKEFQMPLAPVYSIPVGVTGLRGAWSYDPSMQLVFSQRAVTSSQVYSVDFVRMQLTPQQLRTAQPMPANSQIQREFTEVPAVPEVDAQVANLIAGKETVYDKVRALYDFFSIKNRFVYDLTAPQGTSGDAIVDFLRNRKGFCEQYAAALTWMARSAGIPARVAFGFTNGSNLDKGVYTLTNRNLHAWTEIYFQGYGWVPFDSTPSTSVSGSVVSAWAPNVDAPDPSTGPAGPTLSPGATTSAGPLDPEDDRNIDEGFDGGGAAGAAPIPPWVWWSAVGAVLALALLSLPGLRRIMLRRRRWNANGLIRPVTDGAEPPAGPLMRVVSADETEAVRRRAHAAWDELIDTLIDYRVLVDPAETPRSTAERLVRQQQFDASVAADARLLGSAEERARYSREPLHTDRLAPALSAVHRAVAGRAGRRTRLMATFLPPSVLQSWRNSFTALMTRASLRITEVNSGLSRILRPLHARRLRRLVR
jgi:transglutaminase-like putative cysteine protease